MADSREISKELTEIAKTNVIVKACIDHFTNGRYLSSTSQSNLDDLMLFMIKELVKYNDNLINSNIDLHSTRTNQIIVPMEKASTDFLEQIKAQLEKRKEEEQNKNREDN